MYLGLFWLVFGTVVFECRTLTSGFLFPRTFICRRALLSNRRSVRLLTDRSTVDFARRLWSVLFVFETCSRSFVMAIGIVIDFIYFIVNVVTVSCTVENETSFSVLQWICWFCVVYGQSIWCNVIAGMLVWKQSIRWAAVGHVLLVYMDSGHSIIVSCYNRDVSLKGLKAKYQVISCWSLIVKHKNVLYGQKDN